MDAKLMTREGGSVGMIIILGILALTFVSCAAAMICLFCNCICIG